MRKPKKTITIDLTSYLQDGTYSLKAKTTGTGIKDSAFSSAVSCVVDTTPVGSAISCQVSGLGSENTSNVSFIKDADFTLAGLGITEETLNGNVFIKIPTMYRKIVSTNDDQITSFIISNSQVDATYYPYPCFVDESGNTLPYIMIGKYQNKNSSGINSVASGSETTQDLATARTYARALGTGYQLFDWMIQRLWQDLLICFMETIDTNSGSGIDTDALGINWNYSSSGMWVDGIIRGTTNYWWVSYKPSAYVSLSSTSDGIPTNYVATNYMSPTSSGNIVKLGYDASQPFANYCSSASGSTYTTYYCDRFYTSSGSRPFYSRVGRSLANLGAFYSLVNSDWSYANWVRLCYRPLSA